MKHISIHIVARSSGTLSEADLKDQVGQTIQKVAVVFLLGSILISCGRSDPVLCANTCKPQGALRCSGDILQACAQVSVHCKEWVDFIDCAVENSSCVVGFREAGCRGDCFQCDFSGQSRCALESIEVCIRDNSGCLVWRETLDCSFYGEECIQTDEGPTCSSTCEDLCPAEGTTRCTGNTLQTCLTGGNGCLGWVTTILCPPDMACDDSSQPAVCICRDLCNQEGRRSCDENVVVTCVRTGDGCLDWLPSQDCRLTDQICTESVQGASCEDCIPNCAGRQCGPDPVCGQTCGTCQGATEVCREGLGNCDDVCAGRECGVVEGRDCGTCVGATFVCREETGRCEDVCAGLECGTAEQIECGSCPDGEHCVSGTCYGPICDGEMCLVPEGTFWMGCNEDVDAFCEADENPYHLVFLDQYEIDKYEVTQSAYMDCILAGVCQIPASEFDPELHADYPVVMPSSTQAFRYCQWSGKRLCTEAEWEKAARGDDGRRYPWGNEPASCELAVMYDCVFDGTAPVGSKPAGESPYGAMDMAGNVWEWVNDYYSSTYYSECYPSCSNPPGPEDGEATNVIRGGDFISWPRLIRVSERATSHSYDPDYIGIRCCR